ncbi:MAG: HNH endonuclease signature motif containing protein [Dehalococcoidia bacterium]
MTSRHIPRDLRDRVARQAGDRCGYCRSHQGITGQRYDVEHIIPLAPDGKTEETNLRLSCGDCNARKADRVDGYDRETDEVVLLSNPRTQRWSDHVAWSDEGTRIIGLTATGRITVPALQLNRRLLVEARRRWVASGWRPPPDEP